MRLGVDAMKLLERGLRSLLAEQRREFLGLQRAKHVAQTVRAFGVPHAGVVFEAGVVGDQGNGHAGSAFLRMTKLNTPASSLIASSAWPDSRQ